ncbi:diacylglycerol kinase family protein [Verrucomicrobiota bacterium]
MEAHRGRGKFSVKARVRSIGFALEGVRTLMLTQYNAWVHCVAIVAVCGFGFWLEVSRMEWAVLVLAMMAVLSAEALNTAMEFLADAVIPEEHPEVKKAKDVAAGGVLIAAIASVIIAMLILMPHLIARCWGG